jgi:hypothetical protein
VQEIEEAWIVQALIREDGLNQVALRRCHRGKVIVVRINHTDLVGE